MSETNDFGGGNKHSLYIPLTEIEQEFIARLVESGELIVTLHGWGAIQPVISFGDKVLHAHIGFTFDKAPPPPGREVYYFDMELHTQSGISLYRQKMPTVYGNEPLRVSNEITLNMVWDISLHHIDPKLIKALMPSVLGLTSRMIDKDSQEAAITGNMKLNQDLQKKAYKLHEGEQILKEYDTHRLNDLVGKKTQKKG